MRKKWDIDEARILFSSNGCQLLSNDYRNARTPLEYVCVCGNVSQIRLDDFQRGKRCRGCASAKKSELMRMDTEEAVKYFSNFGYRIESVDLRKSRQYFNYTCPRGHSGTIVFFSFRDGYRCAKCAKERSSERYRLPIERVREEFESAGCELLSTTYTNMNDKLKYKCSCGNISYTYLTAIRKGVKCGCQRLRGEENPNWNSGITDEERKIRRNYPEYREWLKGIYERDNYTCKKCGETGGVLNAHHIKSYAGHRAIRTELSNGITLCETCHRSFHTIYGLRDFGGNELREFLQNGRCAQ